MTAKEQLVLAGKLKAWLEIVPLINESRTAEELGGKIMAMIHEAERQLAGQTSVMTNEHKRYLDELRRSGITNMLGAAPYLRQAFPALTREQSTKVLGEWMRTFKETDR